MYAVKYDEEGIFSIHIKKLEVKKKFAFIILILINYS